MPWWSLESVKDVDSIFSQQACIQCWRVWL